VSPKTNESNVAFGLDTEPKRIRTAKRAFRHRDQPGKFFKRLTALIPAAQARCQISYTLSGVKCRSEPLVIRDTELGACSHSRASIGILNPFQRCSILQVAFNERIEIYVS
jgi:hypothetical protein